MPPSSQARNSTSPHSLPPTAPRWTGMHGQRCSRCSSSNYTSGGPCLKPWIPRHTSNVQSNFQLGLWNSTRTLPAVLPLLVMATLAKRKRTKASIIVFSSISTNEHLHQKEKYFRNTLDRTKINFRCEANTFDTKTTVFIAKANMFDSEKIILEAKLTHYIERKLFSKRSEHIRQKENYFRNETNTLDRTKKIFKAKRTCSIARQLFSKQKRKRPSVRNYF